MPKVRPLRNDLRRYAETHNLGKKIHKQIRLLEKNLKHPSLHTEILEPRKLRIFSFRIDKKYRAIFIFLNGDIEIIDMNPHYK